MNQNAEWDAFLDSLSTPLHTSSAARMVWRDIKKAFPGELPLPLTQRTSEGAIQFAWDSGERYAELEIFDDKLEWFYRERESGVLEVGLEPLFCEIPSDFLECLTLTVGA